MGGVSDPCVSDAIIVKDLTASADNIGCRRERTRTILWFTNDPVDHLDEMLDSANFVVRVSKSMSVPERPKLGGHGIRLVTSIQDPC